VGELLGAIRSLRLPEGRRSRDQPGSPDSFRRYTLGQAVPADRRRVRGGKTSTVSPVAIKGSVSLAARRCRRDPTWAKLVRTGAADFGQRVAEIVG
jgi:hypothetical protein